LSRVDEIEMVESDDWLDNRVSLLESRGVVASERDDFGLISFVVRGDWRADPEASSLIDAVSSLVVEGQIVELVRDGVCDIIYSDHDAVIGVTFYSTVRDFSLIKSRGQNARGIEFREEPLMAVILDEELALEHDSGLAEAIIRFASSKDMQSMVSDGYASLARDEWNEISGFKLERSVTVRESQLLMPADQEHE
jgi:hypothetical protein